MLGHHDAFCVGASLGKPLLKPGDGEARRVRTVTQAIEELRGEGIVRGQGLERLQEFFDLGVVVETDQLVDGGVGLLAGNAALLDAARNTAQVFDKDIAHQRGNGPKLADLQHLHRLEAFDERQQALIGYRAMRVGDVEPSQRHGARHHHAVDGQRLQLVIKLLRKIAADFLDGFFDDVVVIEQPFGGRRDRLAGIDIGIGRAIDAQDLFFVFLVTREEIEGRKSWQLGFRAIAGKGRAAFLYLLVGEIGGADRIVMIDLLGFRIARRNGGEILRCHGFGFWVQTE